MIPRYVLCFTRVVELSDSLPVWSNKQGSKKPQARPSEATGLRACYLNKQEKEGEKLLPKFEACCPRAVTSRKVGSKTATRNAPQKQAGYLGSLWWRRIRTAATEKIGLGIRWKIEE